MTARLPPQDVAAEAAVVAACLLDAGAVDRVRHLVDPHDCYDPRNRRYLAAAYALSELGEPVDPVSVGRRIGTPGVAAELARLVAEEPHVADLEAHARAVRDRAQLRRGIEACQRAAASGHAAASAADWLAATAASLQALELEGTAADLDDGPAAFDDALARYRRAADAGGDTTGLATGFVDFDYRAGLLEPEELVVLAARPGMGKTALAGCIASNVSARGGAVLFATLEMPKRQIAGRMACAEARVDAGAAKRGELDQNELYDLLEAVGRMRTRPIGWLDQAAASPAQIEAAARALRSRASVRGGRLALVVVDYLQLCRGRGESREQEVASVSRDLKAVAKRLRCPVLVLAQLNRAVEGRASKRPVLSDLRESGAIEQDADRVLFLHRDDYYDPGERPGECDLIVAKNRDGATGDVTLRFDAACARFDNLERRG